MTVVEKAYAKINLYLDVLSRLNDGFHQILSIMHSVDLHDTITLSCVESEQTKITITTDRGDLSVGEDNLVYRAVSSYLSYFSVKANVSVHLEKNIPIGAGLGGGSSDAAATLRALNKVLNKADMDQIFELASELGSDVPFCVLGGLCVCESKGEMFTPISKRDNMTFVVAIGEGRVSTPKAYAALDELYNNFTGEMSEETLCNNKKIIELIYNDRKEIPIYNIFEQVVTFDEIDKIKEIMTKNGAEYTLMSGSGPSVFGRFSDAHSAERARSILTNNGFTAFTCKSVYPEVTI